MKKLFALLLCICLLTISVSSFAAADESYKQVLEIVKTRIPDTSEFDDFSASQSETQGVTSYAFSWENSETGESMSVKCLKSGIITRFNIYEDEFYQESAMSDISKEEALKKAKEAFYKLNPDLKDKTVIKNDSQNKRLWETRQYFAVTRVENGVEVYDDTGHIEMDINADKILWYYMNWSDYDNFPNPEDAISIEKAKKAYSEKLGIHLIYKSKVEDGVIKPYLVYTVKDEPYTYIDMNGEVVKCSVYPKYPMAAGSAENDKFLMNDAVSENFSKAEMAEMEKIDDLLSQEEAQKIVKNQELLGLDLYELDSTSLSRDYYDKEKYTYTFSYVYGTAQNVETASVSMNAKNGEILGFHKGYYYGNENNKSCAEEELKNLMDKAVKTFCKTHLDEYELVDSGEEFVEYQRVVNGVKYPSDAIRVGVNKQKGEISSYSKTYTNAEFPSKDGVVSLNMIYKNVFDMFSYRLKYVPTYEDNSKQPEIKLVFAFDSESFDIDPFTGENFRYNEENEVLKYNDIENHYAEKYIEELASYGIGLGNNNFMPDNEIKQKELIMLLVRAFYEYYSTYPISEEEVDDSYERAVSEGIIAENEIEKEAYVTRKDAAKYFVNAMGYGDIAKLDNIFNCPFGDVSENKGAVSILYGLGVVSGGGAGNFNPEENLLRGDTMIMLYRCLSR